MTKDESTVESFQHSVGIRYHQDDQLLLEFVTTRVVILQGVIVAYRAPVNKDGRVGFEEKSINPTVFGHVVEELNNVTVTLPRRTIDKHCDVHRYIISIFARAHITHVLVGLIEFPDMRIFYLQTLHKLRFVALD